MKKTVWMLLSLVALPLQAQSILSNLNQYQDTLEPESANGGGGSVSKNTAPKAEPTVVAAASNNGVCEENDQTSLPLAYVTSLIRAKNGKIEVSYDSRKGKLSLSAPDMIGNCSSMIDWKLRTQPRDGGVVHSIEAKIKRGENCADDGLCEYKVAKVVGTSFKSYEVLKMKPTLEGFEECLKQSGVMTSKGVSADSIYNQALTKEFDGVFESGDVQFVSHGPVSSQVKAKYGKFTAIEKCDHYEAITPQGMKILSWQEEQNKRLNEEADGLKSCNQYDKVADFIDKYADYESKLSDIRDRLILEAAVKSAKALEAAKENEYKEEDFKVMADFDKYIVQPQVNKARALYEELRALDGGPGTEEKKKELAVVLAKLKEYNAKPYFQSSLTQKLIHNGRFDEAEKLNTIKMTLDVHSKLGGKAGGAVITPEFASLRVTKGGETFHNDLESEKEDYGVRTGAITGKEEYYSNLSKNMRRNVDIRSSNFTQEIQEEFARTQPGGYCYRYFRNTQKCTQDSLERIQELQNLLSHYNKVDMERSAEYAEKANKYGTLEAEGRRRIAAEGGEEAAPERPSSGNPDDTTVPSRRSNGTYTFDYNPQQGGAPQQQQQPVYNQNPLAAWQGGGFQYNPYQQQGQYNSVNNPFLGQQAYSTMPAQFNMGNGYNFQWNGGGQQQQQMYGQQNQFGVPGQQGYWSQPYAAYNMYNMYGR